MTRVEQARNALGRGNAALAVSTLERGGASGDAGCWLELAFWNLQGRGIARDLVQARKCFREAAALGNPNARSIYISLLANGTGGAQQFTQAVELLSKAPPKDAESARQLELIRAMNLTAAGDPLEVWEPRHLSDRPNVVIFPELLASEECRYLIDAAAPAFQHASIGQLATGRHGYSHVRTCDVAAFPWVAENPVIHAINRRIAKAAEMPVECGEPLQILRYRPGQEFKPHRDCTEDRENQRVLTMLVYLNEDYTGGETRFLKTGLTVRGKTGDALLFRNARPDGTPDADSTHAGLPVASGEKLLASRWIRQKPFGPRS